MADLKIVDLMLYAGERWRSLDLDKNSSFPFNLQVSDITDPTATKIPFSSQITLPKTKVNDDIFSLIGEYDSQILNINPLVRTDFRLYINNNIFQSGYMQIEYITQSDYHIALYGGLGDYFYTMAEKKLVDLGYDDGNTANAYGRKFEHKINCELVANSFQGLQFQNTSGQNMGDYFGYAMTYQGDYENFDSDTEAVSNTDVQDVVWVNNYGKQYAQPVLNEHRRSFQRTGESIIRFGEYRSYYQRPRVRLRDLYDQILAYMQTQGWNTEKDETFFNDDNPYWNDTWVICPQYTIANGETDPPRKYFTYSEVPTLTRWYGRNAGGARPWSLGTLASLGDITDDTQTLYITVYMPIYLFVEWVFGGSSQVRNGPRGFTITPELFVGDNDPVPLRWTNNRDVTSIDVNTANMATQKTGGASFYVNWKEGPLGAGPIPSSQIGIDYATLFELQAVIELEPGTYNPNDQVIVRFNGDGDTYWYNTSNSNNKEAALQIRFGNWPNGADVNPYIQISKSQSEALRSNSTIEFKQIISSDNSCFDFFMSFNKIFGLYHVKDPASNTVKIQTRNTYYGLQERLDWTGKIDYSKEIRNGTINLDYRYGVFAWRNQGTKYEEKYLADYSREYGSVIFDTNYQFSEADDELMSKVIFGNMIRAIDYSQYYLGRTNLIYQDNKVLPYLADNSGSRVDTDYLLCFLDGQSTTVDNTFCVTDDLPVMLQYGYCWNSTRENSVATLYYPNLTRTIGDGDSKSSLNFGTPRIAYDGTPDFGEDSSSGADTIYSRFWQSYIRDIHDANTRVVTCYVNLTLADVYQDIFNKFIFIKNVPYVLSKIYNFDPTKTRVTKVDLISVQNIDNYVGQQYVAGNLSLTYNGTVIYDSTGETPGATASSPVIIRVGAEDTNVTLSVNSSLPWKIGSYDDTLLTIVPVSGLAGTTSLSISFPANTSGSAESYTVPIQWGSTTTIVQIVQVSNWTVSASSNVGTATSNGEQGEIQVADGENVTFETTGEDGYVFGYWIVTDDNGINYYYTRSLTVTITSNTTAEAVWAEASDFGWENNSLEIDEQGGTLTNYLNVPSGLSYTITTTGGITSDPTTGVASRDITFTIPENEDPMQRSFTVTATYSNGNTSVFTITQAAAFIPELSIDPTFMEVGPNITQYQIQLTCNTTWQCVIDPIYDGIVNVSPLFGEGDTTVNVTTGVNPSGAARIGIAEFRTTYGENDLIANHTVRQRPLEGTIAVRFLNSTRYEMVSTEDIIGSIMQGSEVVQQFIVDTFPGGGIAFRYQVNEGEYKVSLSAYGGLLNTGTTLYRILPDEEQTINAIGGQSVEVTYTVSTTTSLSLGLTPSEIALTPASNTFELQVIATTGIFWELTSNVSWISFSQTSGNGRTFITVIVEKNTLGNRQGQITVTAQGSLTLTDQCDVSQTGIL